MARTWRLFYHLTSLLGAGKGTLFLGEGAPSGRANVVGEAVG